MRRGRQRVEPTMREVQCPYCWDSVLWTDDEPVWIFGDGGAEPERVEIAHMLPQKKAELRWRGYRPCPNPSDDVSVQHWLPALLGEFPDPLVIGFVGASESGKTHLLVAMLREVLPNGLGSYGIEVGILDHRQHRIFQRQIGLLDSGLVLDSTNRQVFGYAEMLRLRRIRDGATRLVIFYDVAGEDLLNADTARGAAASRFFLGGPALIFTHAAADTPLAGTVENGKAIGLALERVKLGDHPERRPAAIVLTKADRLQFVPPIDRWLDRPSGRLDAASLRAESLDVYAHLYRAGAGSSLAPFDLFTRCTLHAVSASGGDAIDRPGKPSFYPRPRGIRVLEPLIAILAMAGVLDGPEAARVGLP